MRQHRRASPRPGIDAEAVGSAAALGAALVIGLATARDFGLTIDEFNTDDYGPKALAWYTSGFVDRSHFETVEETLWYYGPWFQMLTAWLQSFEWTDRATVRHAATFLVGLAGIAALLPIGRLAGGRWVGLAAIILCLTTGYLYGSLFFTPIDVPFLAVMTWSMLAILLMCRTALPSWPATLATGVVTGLALATRTGGIITHVYLLGALTLCAVQHAAERGRLPPRYLLQLGARYVAVLIVAWTAAIALWPWLQIGNPFRQFAIAFQHFTSMPMVYEFPHWGTPTSTQALPRSYVPGQLLARLPEGFLLLLAAAGVSGALAVGRRSAVLARMARREGGVLRAAAAMLGRHRAMLIVLAAVALPLGFVATRNTVLYDGIRHLLFVIPMLAIVAGLGWRAMLPLLRRAPVLAGAAVGLYLGYLLAVLAALHPLQYVAMNALAGGTSGAYDSFELDYWSAAAVPAIRRLEQRLDYDPSIRSADTPPSIVVCIPWRESNVGPLLQRPWVVETDPDAADYIIETQRSRCAADSNVVLIDEVKRQGRTFAWIYRRIEPAERLGRAGS
jgi:hypothetical protein